MKQRYRLIYRSIYGIQLAGVGVGLPEEKIIEEPQPGMTVFEVFVYAHSAADAVTRFEVKSAQCKPQRFYLDDVESV